MKKSDYKHVKERQLSEEEKNLWYTVTKNDKPLDGRQRSENPIREKKNTIKSSFMDMKKNFSIKSDSIKSNSEKSIKKNNISKTNNHFTVDRRTNQKLQRGLIRPEVSLDLHGLSQILAQERFSNFIVSSSLKGIKCVLVVTGRKLGLYGPEGVLRASVPSWIQKSEVRKYVLSYSYAQQRDGGDGAFYILLRKHILNKNTTS